MLNLAVLAVPRFKEFNTKIEEKPIGGITEEI